MSYIETHFGKFKILAKGEENIRQYFKEHDIETDKYDDICPFDTHKYCVTYPYEKDGINILLNLSNMKNQMKEMILRNFNKMKTVL